MINQLNSDMAFMKDQWNDQRLKQIETLDFKLKESKVDILNMKTKQETKADLE